MEHKTYTMEFAGRTLSFEFGRYGYAAAMGIVLFAIIALLVLIQYRLVNASEQYYRDPCPAHNHTWPCQNCAGARLLNESNPPHKRQNLPQFLLRAVLWTPNAISSFPSLSSSLSISTSCLAGINTLAFPVIT